MLKSMVLFLGALCVGTAANATVINVDYLFDGSSLTSAHGNELFGTSLSVGDTLNLSYRAVGENSYWDFSQIRLEGNVNLNFNSMGACASRAVHGSYNASLNGRSVLADTYSRSRQRCVHGGPNFINFSSVDMLDEFTISYVLDSSTQNANIIGDFGRSTWWQVWELFDGSKASFHYLPDQQAVDVSEPASLAILGLGLMGIGLLRRKQKH